MKTVQIYNLCDEDFTEQEPKVQVTTRMASTFIIERVRRGTYIAYNRTEFVGGQKIYNGIEGLRRDLLIR
jgi:hypothetical protein